MNFNFSTFITMRPQCSTLAISTTSVTVFLRDLTLTAPLPFSCTWEDWRDLHNRHPFSEEMPCLLTPLWAVRFWPDEVYRFGPIPMGSHRADFAKLDGFTVREYLRHESRQNAWLVPFAMRGRGPHLNQGSFELDPWSYQRSPQEYADRAMVAFGSGPHKTWIRSLIWSRFLGNEQAAGSLKLTGDATLEYGDAFPGEVGISVTEYLEALMTIRTWLRYHAVVV